MAKRVSSTKAAAGTARDAPGFADEHAPDRSTPDPPDRRAADHRTSAIRRGQSGAGYGIVGIRVWVRRFDREPSGAYQAAQAICQVTNSLLPVELAVHTALYFRKLEPHWRVLYARPTTTNALPVMIERSWGRGSLVLAADAYPFSNEALRHEPTAALLSWFVGRNHRVVFEEAHLGVSAEPGVAALARQYRLTGLFLAALVLAGLFVWKSSVSFLPRHAHEIAREESNEVVGRDSASGLSNLLTRHLPPAELMRTCLEQWNEHVSRHQRPSPARLEAMQNLINAENALPPTQRNPIRLYREFHRILSKRKS